MRVAADSIIVAALAPACLSCAQVLDEPTRSPVCVACWGRIARFTPPLCDRCGLPAGPNVRLRTASADRNPLVLCPACERDRQSPVNIRHVRSIGPFDGVLRDVIHSLKFEGRRSLAAHLGPLARDAARDVLLGADAVVPVPLHPWRQWRRGFNQATLTAETLGLPLWPVLARTRATRAQSELEADARHANVAGAFRLAGWTQGGRGRTAQRVRGRTLVLVDDVLTTGATLDACAQPLLAAGAAEIRALTVARVSLQHTRAISA